MIYTTTKKELLTVVYVMEKLKPYMLCSKVIVYTNHATLKYFLENKDAKPLPHPMDLALIRV